MQSYIESVDSILDVRTIQIFKERNGQKQPFRKEERCFLFPKWWSQAGSNRRPPACKAGALPAELWPHLLVFLPGCFVEIFASAVTYCMYAPLAAQLSPRFQTKIPHKAMISKAFSKIQRRYSENWWVWEDLNFRPHPYQGCALTN